jgi:DNA recombination protein RmuC
MQKKRRVYPVSPSTLYAHLQTILLSFEGKKIESRAREVFKLLRALQIDYEKTNENLGILGRHLGNAQSQFSSLQSNFVTFGNKLQNAKHLETESPDLLPDKPNGSSDL